MNTSSLRLPSLRRWQAFILAALLASLSVQADWVNLTGAETAVNILEIRIDETGVTVGLEMYINDVDRWRANGQIGLTVFADGQALSQEVLLEEQRNRVDRLSPYAGMIDPRTRREIPGPPKDKRVLYTKLHYPFDELPSQVTFSPPEDERGAHVLSIGFLSYHGAAPINDFRHLAQPETLHLNWDDPWFSQFENRNLKRHHRWPQMSFMYIEPREVRHEILVRVRDLMEWTQDAPDLHARLTEEDQEALKRDARKYFDTVNPLRIDGELSQASTFRAEFLNIGTTGLEVVQPDTAIDASAAIMGVSLSHWRKSLPQNVTVDWELFDERVDRVPTNITDPAGPYPSFVTEDAPLIEWQNFLKKYREPVLVPASVGEGDWLDSTGISRLLTGTPSEKSATYAVARILQGVRVAYIERDPIELDNALAKVAVPANLADLKMELNRVYAIPTTGGGVASISRLGNLKIQNLDEVADGFSVLASWHGLAEGKHWGHIDRRALQFRALLEIVEQNGAWKLSEMTVVEAQQLDL